MGNNSNGIDQAYIPGNHKAMPLGVLQNIVAQLKCACKIVDGKNLGTGFFCKIPFPDESNLLPVLMTCNKSRHY